MSSLGSGLASLAMLSADAGGSRTAAGARLRLWGDLSLADPWFLLLIPVALAAFYYGRSRRARAVGVAPVLPAGAFQRSWRQRLGWLPAALQATALVVAVVALARPLRGNEERQVVSEGVDIALVIDRSGSMRFDDLERRKTRLDVVKDVVADFARRRMSDTENAADNVGLITFARYPELLCPFTLDVDALLGFLAGVEIVKHQAEDGTGIGVALAKAVALLAESDARSRVVVLLTDGENNVTDIMPRQAGELAAEKGVKVYTIYAARNLFAYDPVGGYIPTSREFDTSELREIAELSGGRFFRARDREGLEGIYSEIEELERTPRREQRYEENFDLYPVWLWWAFGLYGIAWLFHSTWARRLP